MKKPKLIHCSFDEVYSFEPRVPKSRSEYEDDQIKRICVSPTIRQCIDAIPRAGNIMRFMREVGMPVVIHAYYLEADKVEYDTTEYVPDADVTGEMWILEKPTDWKRIDYELTSFALKDGKDRNGSDITWVYGVWPVRHKYTDNLRELIEGIGENYDRFRSECPDISFRLLAGNATPEMIQDFKERREKVTKKRLFGKPQKTVKIYMRTTGDDLDLPVAVADSPGELAEMVGTTKECVMSSISHKHKGWHRVEVENE